MNLSIMESVQTLIVLCTLVTTFSAAVNVFTTFHKKVRSPERVQNDRIEKLEQYAKNDKQRIELLEKGYNRVDSAVAELTKRTTSMQDDMDKYKERMDAVERGERVTHNALFAIMNYMVTVNDGQDKSRLVAARDKLNEYLVEK